MQTPGGVQTETIEVWRAGTPVLSLAGSFGRGLKETRITALLGYLIGLRPEPFVRLFRFAGTPRSVSLETHEDSGRSDILINTSSGVGVIEAKIDATDPLIQARKYKARWRALLTHHHPACNGKSLRGVTYVTWGELGELLAKVEATKDHSVRFLAHDLRRYLQEHRMVQTNDTVEVYAREINAQATLTLFLKARMYGCDHKRNSRQTEALYFAPHFGKSIAGEHPGVSTGISYIASIEHVEVVSTWKELVAATKSLRGASWYKKNKAYMDGIRQTWNLTEPKARCFFFLGPPRLSFNPPIRKENLQDGKGWLSRQFFSFDELFSAWGA